VLRQHGVIRVDSLEDLLTTAGLFGYVGPLAGRRMGVVTASGGACDIIADRAADEGIEIPDFAPATVEAIAAVLPSFAAVRNPLDTTGFMLADPAAAAGDPGVVALNALIDDPGIDFIFNAMALPAAQPPDPTLMNRRLAGAAAARQRSPKPIVHFTNVCTDVSLYARGLLAEHGLHVLGGIELGLRAIGHALAWSTARTNRPSIPMPRQTGRVHTDRDGPWSEAAARELVAGFGVPVVPAELVTSADAAVAAADRLGYPVVLKVCAAALTHKSDVGGVALGLADAAGVTAAFDRLDALARAHDGDGVLVSPLRDKGIELFAGVTVDPAFGPVLAVGLGGVWIEILGDVSLRALPVPADEVERMLGELRGAALLRGARGEVPADGAAVARAVAALADAAVALGPRLRAIEVNPLWVRGAEVEALDVLIVTGQTKEQGDGD
jgi:acyl-CoA synthetase (NDP forming)